MTAIPDSFSMDDLHAAMDSAIEEPEIKANSNDDDKYSEEFIVKTAEDILNKASELIADPIIHKVMMMMICNNMIEWHSKISVKMMDDGEVKSALCWARDAGKFQSMMDSLTNISLGSHDFTCQGE